MPARRDPYQAPAVRAFAATLKAMRKTGKLSQHGLAEVLGYTSQFVSQVEGCKNIPSRKFSEDLDTHFQTNELFVSLWEVIDDTLNDTALPPGFTDFTEREAEASALYIFAAMVIHGLHQTPEYVHEVLRTGRTPEEIEKLVSTRTDRQRILTRENPPLIVAVFDEGAIRRMVGNPKIMKGQIAHLIDLAEMPHVTFHIVPASKGSYAGLPGAFTILRFNDAPDMVYTEGHTGGNLTDHAETVWGHTVRFDLIRGAAMSADQSLELLRSVWESL
ncbi:Scr1 family TA system antitoxin-like transcriptional regulator [Actinomadura macra]|uniref:Scr1 family TA system antitoxin-like transcriptional regulator n=1 Tax=Actinomadura macra TaxID=46164 RepID=UPI000A401566|nr:Scr1 family TA system antitoxin-like transcriptional regulator [Actinomadura macra]